MINPNAMKTRDAVYHSHMALAGPRSRNAKRDPRVTVDSEPLAIRLDLRAHSPTGFSWGYAGSGPAQLALAILANHFNTHAEDVSLVPAEEREPFVNETAAKRRNRSRASKASNLNADVAALALYQDFKGQIVARWPQGRDWRITSAEITRWVESVRDPLTAEAHKAVADGTDDNIPRRLVEPLAEVTHRPRPHGVRP